MIISTLVNDKIASNWHIFFRMTEETSTPGKRFIWDEDEKAAICSKISEVYRYLSGAYEGKYTKEARETKLDQIWEFSKTQPKSKNFFKSPKEVWTKFGLWKANLVRKEKNEKKTGAAPNKKLSDAEKIISEIVHRYDGRMAELKVSCLSSC